jgi:hypothetical protein
VLESLGNTLAFHSGEVVGGVSVCHKFLERARDSVFFE